MIGDHVGRSEPRNGSQTASEQASASARVGDQQQHRAGRSTGHRWMMLACCVPMLIAVAFLLASGTAGAGAIVFAAVCVGMMAVMMFAMPGGHRH
jgi:hypothetical protein